MKVFILSLGCAKNRVDSECLAGELQRAGHTLVDSVTKAYAVIVNTCGFIRPAVEENIAEILELEELRAAGKIRKLGIVGCLYNRYGKELSDGFENVDFWAKSEDWDTVLNALKGEPSCGRVRANLPDCPSVSRYLKVSEGCNNRCTYCKIPSIRGNLRSLSIDTIVREAQQLAEEGARELCLVGQDLTAYGMDIDGKPKLLELLDALEYGLPDRVRLRLLYLHPERVTVRLMERIAGSKMILNYLDVPIQHADEKILVSMNRAMTHDRLAEIFAYARSLNPYFALRTTCMVGFPGERHNHFQNLLNFLEEVRFDRVGAFIYSPEDGTAACDMPQIGINVAEKRLAALMELQEEISLERQQLFLGKRLQVLVERVEGNYVEGRSYREAPEVDGVIEVEGAGGRRLQVGNVIDVEVIDAAPHDLIARQLLLK